MCFSQFAQYAPRPVYQYEAPERPEDAQPTMADLDENLFGPKPLPPQWQQPVVHDHGHIHDVQHQNGNGTVAAPVAAPVAAIQVAQSQANGSTTVASVTTQTVEAVVVELSNGTKLLICPL
ncbi:MAG: hypothetical protein WA996_16695 [Candidatus Promineifilaceae bacterium]